MNIQLSLLDWKPVTSPSSSKVVLHKPELCARCDTHGRAMCTNCKNAEEEERKKSEKPMTAEEIAAFFSDVHWSQSRPR